MEYRYVNPWARPTEPAEYVRHVEPVEYNGCQLFHVLPMQWDTVKSGVCIAQRVSLEGAKHAADLVEDMTRPEYTDVWRKTYEECEA